MYVTHRFGHTWTGGISVGFANSPANCGVKRGSKPTPTSGPRTFAQNVEIVFIIGGRGIFGGCSRILPGHFHIISIFGHSIVG